MLYADLDSVTDDDGAEYYVIQLWPGASREAVIARAREPVDEPIRTTSARRAEAEAALRTDDLSAYAHGLVALARAGGVEEVARIGREHASRAIRLLAVNALRLVNARDAIRAFAASDDAAIRGGADRALERLA